VKFNQARDRPDKVKWKAAVEEYHERMRKQEVLKVVKKYELPKKANAMSSTWSTRMRVSGKFRARMNPRGFEEFDGQHYDSKSTSTSVANEITICIFIYAWA
jgi:hypothetical protein